MASAIGIRVYRISVHKKRTGLSANVEPLSKTAGAFISGYVKAHSTATQNEEMERSWYFDIKHEDGHGNCSGYIHYGTFGFESNFIDAKTKKRNYRRKTTDVEEIPLYFEFWIPKGESFGFAAFQSFQGRSCINLAMSGMKAAFEKQNPDSIFGFRKMLPNDAANSIYRNFPVKRFRLIKRDAPSDVADTYFHNPHPDSVNFEVSISARRNKSLGEFGTLFKSLKTKSKNVITYDGIDFPEAVADIRVGNKTRRVGVFGLSGDAGVVDITEDIKRGPDGHPTFNSLAKEAGAILEDMYEALKGDRS